MKRILISTLFVSGFISFAQVRNNNTPTTGINGTTAFLDASSSNTWNGTNNQGKGLVFPRTDLTAMTSLLAPVNGLPTAFPTRLDGMVVYNTGTGTAGTGTANTPVAPGFYYYDNKSTTLNGGTWKPFTSAAATSAPDLKSYFWSLDGNGAATPVTYDPTTFALGTTGKFIGTTDANNVVMATNRVARLEIGSKTGVDVGGASFDFILDVFGKARFRKGIVTEFSTYPDYVFEKYFTGSSKINPNYQFKSLAETEKFVKENNHLPGVSKITEFSKDGQKYLVDAAELSVQNLEKVEELYLHTIEQQKQIDALKAELAEIKAALKK